MKSARRILAGPWRPSRPPASPKPPDPDPLPRINDLIGVAKAGWLGLLAYLAFVGVTLIGVVDADFFLPERRTQLPLIGVTIPTTLFFAIAPALGAMLYTYLHLYLLRLWEALAEAPAQVGGVPLGDAIRPWLIADYALSRRPDAPLRNRPLRDLANWVTWLFIFVAAPVVLAGFWWRSMPKHDELLTVIACGVPLFVTLYAGVASWVRLRRLARGDRALPLWGRGVRALWVAGGVSLTTVGWFTTEGTLAAYAQVSRISVLWFEIEFQSIHDRAVQSLDAELKALAQQDITHLRERFASQHAAIRDRADVPDHVKGQLLRLSQRAEADDIPYYAEREIAGRWWMQTPFPGLLVPARLSGVVFVETPANWLVYDQARRAHRIEQCRAEGLSPTLCGPGPGDDADPPPNLPLLRMAWCTRAYPADTPVAEVEALCDTHFVSLDDRIAAEWAIDRAAARDALPRRDLAGADLRRANLAGARMEGVNLREARMEGALLWQARMEGAKLGLAQMERADIGGAWMEGADLTLARIEGTNLNRARMEGAKLTGARMEGANFSGARMGRADFIEVRMDGANLWEANMEGAIFWRARMEGAILSHASMERADFREARMEDADLWRARMAGTDLRGARMEAADLSGTWLEGSDLRSVRMDARTDLSGTLFQGAAFRRRDYSSLRISEVQVNATFGDASVTLPLDIPRPEHWPEVRLNLQDFNEEWRRWQANPAAYTPPPPPDAR